MPSGIYKRIKPIWNKGLKFIYKPKRKDSIYKICLNCKTKYRKKSYYTWNRWYKQKYCSLDCYGIDNRGKINEKSPSWKGNDVGYSGLHDWVRKMLGKPKYCEKCKTILAKRYVWANKSHKYKRDLKDWIRLCCKCHNIYDNIYKKIWINRKKNTKIVD